MALQASRDPISRSGKIGSLPYNELIKIALMSKLVKQISRKSYSTLSSCEIALLVFVHESRNSDSLRKNMQGKK